MASDPTTRSPEAATPPGGRTDPSAFGRVAARLARQVDTGLADLDLSASQYRILMFLADGSEAASVLADKLAVTRPSVTALVDGLVARGLVERRNDPHDRRRVGHTLTDEGRRVLGLADEAVTERLREIAGHLPDEADRAVALGALDLWREALDATRAAAAQRRRQ